MQIHLFVMTLVIISAVGFCAKYFRIPYTPLLVLTGTLISLWKILPILHFDPDLLFAVLLPPLLFEGAIRISFEHFKKTVWGIFLLASPGVLLSILILGFLFRIMLPFSPLSCFLFAALLSATDPVAVLDAFKRSPVSRELAVLIEGESLFNDGTAMVAFSVMMVILKTGAWSPGYAAGSFIFESGAGLVIGAAFGFLLTLITRQIDDRQVEITFSTILAYGSYLLASSVGASGILAVIAAGIVYGNVATKRGLSQEVKGGLFDFWEYVGFLVNSIIFLLIGTQVNSRYILGYWKPVLLTYVALMAVRFIVVYLLFLAGRISRRRFSKAWMWLTWWSGLRGALCLGLAMTLPPDLAERASIFDITLGVVFIFLFFNGLSTRFFIRFLNLEESKA